MPIPFKSRKRFSIYQCIELIGKRMSAQSVETKTPGLAGRFFILCSLYSPPPKRRDHQPARRGAELSLAASGAGSGAGTGGATGSVACATGAAGSLALLDRKLTFSRTVERRRAALSSAGSSSATAGAGSGWAGAACISAARGSG
jgi:hypothetical protein